MTDLRTQHQEYTDTTQGYQDGEPDAIPGDCWRACLASLLEVPLAETPHFIHLYGGGVGAEGEEQSDRWWKESVAWVKEQRPGWTLGWVAREAGNFPVYLPVHFDQGAPDRVIVTGPSPRGAWNHAALYDARTGELAHDPFPDGPGLLDGPGDITLLLREDWMERFND